jgi:MoxR-like ATPase
MEIEFNPGVRTNTGISQSVARQENTQPAENTMPFERTQALEKTLKDTPVRPEMVARASALVADANYPPDDLLGKIAGVLANHINNPQD